MASTHTAETSAPGQLICEAWWHAGEQADFGRYVNDPGEMVARGESAIWARGLPVTTPRQLEFIDPYNLAPFMPGADFSRYQPLPPGTELVRP